MNLKKLLIIALISIGMTNNVFAETDIEKFNRAVQYYNQGNYVKAFPLYKDVAEKGYPEAQFNVGLMYQYGRGVKKDFKQAVYWYQKAAKQGEAQSQTNLGIMYDNGQGVKKDFKQAIYWYQKAAQQGQPQALYNLAMIYGKGRMGVKEDLEESFNYMRLACDNGHQEACALIKRLQR